jgi:hypothetical protein
VRRAAAQGMGGRDGGPRQVCIQTCIGAPKICFVVSNELQHMRECIQTLIYFDGDSSKGITSKIMLVCMDEECIQNNVGLYEHKTIRRLT